MTKLVIEFQDASLAHGAMVRSLGLGRLVTRQSRRTLFALARVSFGSGRLTRRHSRHFGVGRRIRSRLFLLGQLDLSHRSLVSREGRGRPRG